MNFTEYLKLNLPTPTTVVDIDDLNENSIKIDQELKKLKAELETAGSDEEIQMINKKIEELEEVGENLQILINNIKKDVDKKADKEDLSRSSTVVIANYDSHENSKASADIVIEKGENAAQKINDAIQSLKSTGGEVKLMEGNYQLDSKISILIDDITLRGVGSATKLMARNLPTSSRGALVELGEDLNEVDNQVYGISVADLVIDGNDTKEDFGGLALWGAVNCNVSNINCQYNTGNGIEIRSNSSALISNVSCEDNRLSGVLISGNSLATISNVSCEDNRLSGVLISGNSLATISNVSCENNLKTGLQLNDNSTAIINNITAYGNGGDGVSLHGNSPTNISNILSANNKGHGISINSESKCSLTNSRIYNNGQQSCDIMVTKGTHFITNNSLGTKANTSGWGIFIRDSSISSVVANNVLVDDYKTAMIVDRGENTITELSGNVGV